MGPDPPRVAPVFGDAVVQPLGADALDPAAVVRVGSAVPSATERGRVGLLPGATPARGSAKGPLALVP